MKLEVLNFDHAYMCRYSHGNSIKQWFEKFSCLFQFWYNYDWQLYYIFLHSCHFKRPVCTSVTYFRTSPQALKQSINLVQFWILNWCVQLNKTILYPPLSPMTLLNKAFWIVLWNEAVGLFQILPCNKICGSRFLPNKWAWLEDMSCQTGISTS